MPRPADPSRGKRRARPDPLAVLAPQLACEAEVVHGLEEFARAELESRFGSGAQLRAGTKPGNVPFTYAGELSDLLSLQTAGSVYLVRRFDIPRPLALLGHQHFQTLIRMIETVAGLHPEDTFKTFRVSAAGEGSRVFIRLREEISRRTGLTDSQEGDLLLRVRRPVGTGGGFEVSVRLSPRPLSARPWRVCDMPGALNATVARVMVELTVPRPDDRFLNMASGSGTLMIERLLHGPAREVMGAETDPLALECARANLEAAGLAESARLERWDAGDVPLPDGYVTALCADLPFGHLLGSHSENERLYPRILREGARLATPGTRMALLTSEARLLDHLLSRRHDGWTLERVVRISLDGTPLRIYVLIRSHPARRCHTQVAS